MKLDAKHKPRLPVWHPVGRGGVQVSGVASPSYRARVVPGGAAEPTPAKQRQTHITI